jgi:hypothetical protein
MVLDGPVRSLVQYDCPFPLFHTLSNWFRLDKYMKPCGCVVDKQTDKSIYFEGLLERYFAVQMMGINQKCPPLIPIWAIVLLSVAAAVIVVMFGIFIWVKRNQGGYEELA